MENINNPIGIFDSGIGGLSVLNDIAQYLPNEKLIYIADTAYAPYGEKPTEAIIERSEKIAKKLIDLDVKAIVVACNTATAVAVDKLRAQYDLPIVAIEPALKTAVSVSNNKKIGVLATQGTLQSQRFKKLLSKEQQNTKIYTQIGQGLVEEIEQSHTDTTKLNSLLKKLLKPLATKQIDSLVLGCTHYPLVASEITKIIGNKVKIIEPGLAIAKQLKRLLSENSTLQNMQNAVEPLFYTSGNEKNLQSLVNKYYLSKSTTIKVQKIELG